MKLSWSPLLLLAAAILRPITAQVAQGVYIIHSSAASSQILAVPPTSAPPAPVGWNVAQLPPPLRIWALAPVQTGSGPGWIISNAETKKYLSVVNNKVALDTKPFPWSVSQDASGRAKIQAAGPNGAALRLTSPANGAPLSLDPYTQNPAQQWVLQRVQ